MPPQPAREIRAVAAGNGPSGWKLPPFCEVDKRRWRQDCRKERGFRATRVSPSTPHLFARFPVSRISGECDYKQHGAGWRLARRPGRSRQPVKRPRLPSRGLRAEAGAEGRLRASSSEPAAAHATGTKPPRESAFLGKQMPRLRNQTCPLWTTRGRWPNAAGGALIGGCRSTATPEEQGSRRGRAGT